MAPLVALALAPLVAWLLFWLAIRRWGVPRGYNLAFAAYWLGCGGATIALLGGVRTVALFAPRAPGLLQLGLLLVPLAGAVGWALVPQLAGATPQIALVAVGRAAANAVCEELFWRGLFIASFPTRVWTGWLVPAAVFALWHLVPLRAARAPGRHGAFLAGASAIGILYGWVAWRSGSILWTTAAHVLVDACGLDAARFSLGLSPRTGAAPARS